MMDPSASTNVFFRIHFTGHDIGQTQPPSSPPSSPPHIALGMLQWGTINIINGPRGILTEQEAREIYETFRSSGVVLFDTAEGYGGGTSEKRLGRLLQQEREETSRISSDSNKEKTETGEDDGGTVATDITEDARVNHNNDIIVITKFLPTPWRWTHAHFESALHASNKRLGISTTDCYLLHSPMHLFREIEYWVESAAICKRKGLLKTFGLSNCSAEEVRRAVDAGKKFGVTIAVNQVHFSLIDYNSKALHDMQRTCEELDVAIIAYNTLGQGMLTEKFTKERFAGSTIAKMMHICWDDLKPLRTALREIADAHSSNGVEKRSMAQVAISWCREHNIIPLVGCRSKQQAEDSLASLSLHLTSEEVAKLDALALDRCTLDKPAWRRKLFVVLAGIITTVCRWLDYWGVGTGRIQL